MWDTLFNYKQNLWSFSVEKEKKTNYIISKKS